MDGTSVSYTSNALNQYSAAGNFSYSHDNDGNLVTRTNGTDTWSYTYDELNRLVSSTSPEGNKEYIYNGLGQLAQVITDGVATYYITDPIGLGNLVGEYDDNGDLAHRYTHGLGLLAKNNDFYTFDGNGNTSELTDSSGQILNYYVYTPFGKVLYDVEDTDNDFEFVGQFGVRHMNSDFTYMRNRFYMPSTGRFYSEDPIGLAGGDVSFYRYVGNDPVNFIDPEGKSAGLIVAGGIVASLMIEEYRDFFKDPRDYQDRKQKHYQPQIENRVEGGAAQMNAALQMPFAPGHPIPSKFQYDHWKRSNPDSNYLDFYLDSCQVLRDCKLFCKIFLGAFSANFSVLELV